MPVAPDALEARAARAMSPEAAAYIIGGAGSEATMRANRAAFERHRFVPRVLRDVSQRDLSVTLFGRTHPAPVLLAPVGVLEMVHREADLAVARAAAAEGIGYIFSNQASVPMEECAAAMGERAALVPALLVERRRIRPLARRAAPERRGCEAIVVTLDTTLLGWRPRDLDLAYLPFLRGLGLAQYLSDPVFRAKIPATPPETGVRPRGLGIIDTLLSLRRKGKAVRSAGRRACARRWRISPPTYSRPDLTWADIARLRAMTQLPILLEGHPPRRRREAGPRTRRRWHRCVEPWRPTGRWRDRHARCAAGRRRGGGRPAGALRFRHPLGQRRRQGAGARGSAVLVGRPYVYGLAIAGEAGVREVIRNIVAEFDLTLALSGLTRVSELNGGCLTGEERFPRPVYGRGCRQAGEGEDRVAEQALPLIRPYGPSSPSKREKEKTTSAWDRDKTAP